MPKTPDEIKKGLECCVDGFQCRTNCPYTTTFFNYEKCVPVMATDALALIKQYEKTIDNLAEVNANVHKKCDSLRLRVENREESLRHLNNLRDAAAGRALQMEERVRQLEAELEDMTARYKIADDCAKKKGEMNEKLYAELAAVKAERDAAVGALKSNCVCYECKWFDNDLLEGHCNDCHSKNSSFEWRGVQKEG